MLRLPPTVLIWNVVMFLIKNSSYCHNKGCTLWELLWPNQQGKGSSDTSLISVLAPKFVKPTNRIAVFIREYFYTTWKCFIIPHTNQTQLQGYHKDLCGLGLGTNHANGLSCQSLQVKDRTFTDLVGTIPNKLGVSPLNNACIPSVARRYLQ